jgi:hypothetical protein
VQAAPIAPKRRKISKNTRKIFTSKLKHDSIKAKEVNNGK